MTMAAPHVNYETAWLLGEHAQRGHIEAVLQRIRSTHAVHGHDVLELGSGLGRNLMIFRDDNRVLGVEGMSDAADLARQLGVPTICADLEATLPLASGSADWVLCIDVLEHLVDPKACLDEALRLLRPRGHILINVPNHFDWRGRLRILAGSGIDSQRYFPGRAGWNYPHLRFFTRRDLATLLCAAGLEVVRDCSEWTSAVPRAAWLARVGLGGPVRALSRAWPDLFQAGFFVVCRRAGASAVP
jgi:SAM-dependent methyltransferase